MRQSDTFERERNLHKHSAKSLFEEAMIVREQHTPLQELGGAIHEQRVTAQKAFSLFAMIRWCSHFIAGFAVIVAVLSCSLEDQVK
jgi:hypothetical protein